MGHLPDLIRDLALILSAGATTTFNLRKSSDRSDHEVSESLYLIVLTGMGWNYIGTGRKELWTKKSDLSIDMFTRPLSLAELKLELL